MDIRNIENEDGVLCCGVTHGPNEQNGIENDKEGTEWYRKWYRMVNKMVQISYR